MLYNVYVYIYIYIYIYVDDKLSITFSAGVMRPGALSPEIPSSAWELRPWCLQPGWEARTIGA